MKHPYLIDLNNSENWLYPIELVGADGVKGEDQRTINMGVGEHRLFHVTDSVMYPHAVGGPVFYHEHHVGFEIFFVDSGGLDLYANDTKAYVPPGSILFLQPYVAHAMAIREPTKFRGFFHDLKQSDNAPELAILRANRPEFERNADFLRDFVFINFDSGSREMPDFKEIPVEQMSAVRNIERPMAAYELEGVTMKMLTARWENNGVCELWAAEMKAGFKAEWVEFPNEMEMYYVTAGEVKFKVFDDEFIAYPECVVKIPKFASHSITALTDSVMYDIGGQTRWQALLQDRASILKFDPERAAKPETMEELKTKFKCQIKSFGMK